VPPATAQQCINYCTAFIERFGTEPEQGLIFLQERLHRAVRIIRVEHLCRGVRHGNARAAGAGQIAEARQDGFGRQQNRVVTLFSGPVRAEEFCLLQDCLGGLFLFVGWIAVFAEDAADEDADLRLRAFS